MNHDDLMDSRRIGRRRMLALLGAGMIAGQARAQRAAATPSSPSCILTPEQTEGPYFVDERLKRADIRSDPADGSVKTGVPLLLDLRVFSVGSQACAPVAGAVVDIWHCDANGVYSDSTDRHFATTGKKFLRGYQLTDGGGAVRFITIYPGWYPGRTVHIHFKVRAKAASGPTRGTHEFTSQLYFDDALSDRVFASPPYSARGPRRVRNENDGLFRDGGRRLMPDIVETGEGYAARFDVGLRLA